MKKVVDTNYLQSEKLRDYLLASRNNFAVIADYSAIETYKGNTLVSIFPALEILSEFPRQVIILKSTLVVCGLSGRRAGLQRRLIDKALTQNFPKFCQQIATGKRGSIPIQKQILQLGSEANKQMERMLVDAAAMPEIIEMLSKAYTTTELKILRNSSNVPFEVVDELVKKFFSNISICARQLFEEHPRVYKWPTWEELPNTFIFRQTLCAHLWALRWISRGGAKNVKPEKIRNDLVDLLFATYATYFDGFLTEDKGAFKIYKDTKFWLENFFIPVSKAPRP